MACRLHERDTSMTSLKELLRSAGGRAGPGRWTGSAVLLLSLVLAGCGVRSAATELYPEVAEHQGRLIREVRLVNTAPFAPDSLQQLIDTQPSRCRFLGIPICVPFTRIGRDEHRVNVARIAQDVQALQQAFRIAGYFGTLVVPEVRPVNDDAEVTFTVARGDAIVLDQLTVTGVEGILTPEQVERALLLQPGDVFHLARFTESGDRLLRALQRTRPAQVQRLLRQLAGIDLASKQGGADAAWNDLITWVLSAARADMTGFLVNAT